MREPKIAPAVRSAIFRLPLATRRSIAMCLDSSHVTVSKALQYLESSGDIVPTDTIVPNGSGRPSDVFSLRADAFHGIGIHFEPGYARVVLLNAAKSVVDRWTISLPDRYQKEAEVRQTLRDVSGRAVSLARDLIDPGRFVPSRFLSPDLLTPPNASGGEGSSSEIFRIWTSVRS
jgi:hypothetical protein